LFLIRSFCIWIMNLYGLLVEFLIPWKLTKWLWKIGDDN
jgi:hypothetical protein